MLWRPFIHIDWLRFEKFLVVSTSEESTVTSMLVTDVGGQICW